MVFVLWASMKAIPLVEYLEQSLDMSKVLETVKSKKALTKE